MNYYGIFILLQVVASLAYVRPPAIPLIVSDPYFSIWSTSTLLTDVWPQHWSGSRVSLCGMARIDSQTYRFLGAGEQEGTPLPPAMTQKSLSVGASITEYVFEAGSVELKVQFSSPAVIKENGVRVTDYEYISRGVTYIDFQLSSLDNKSHNVSLYFDSTGEISVDDTLSNVVFQRENISERFTAMKIGSEKQDIFGERGDFFRISWGYLYIGAENWNQRFSSAYESRNVFWQHGRLPLHDNMRMPRACQDDWPVCALSYDNIEVPASSSVHKWIFVSYDDIYSIKYFGESLLPLWKSLYSTVGDMLVSAAEDHENMLELCADFDHKVRQCTSDASYAEVLSLVYRQVMGACKVTTDVNGTIRYFMKEISSDGDIQTTDVIFPASPAFLYFNPYGLYLMLRPLMEYALNETSHEYPFEWAPHHLGVWPVADVSPSQQEQMPVEESANMILMLTAIAKELRDVSFLRDEEWVLLDQWAVYLVANALDPGNQLCTDDFMGPSPHNSNLAAKGIVALGAYSLLVSWRGELKKAQKYLNISQEYALKWCKLAIDVDGSHYKLEYDREGTWSLKYNLIWDKYLQTNVFPSSVFDMESKWYMTKKEEFGCPLDNRADFAKLDWISWAGALGSDWEVWSDIIVQYVNETNSRVPLSDLYYAKTGDQVNFLGLFNFRARSVVGALYMHLLLE